MGTDYHFINGEITISKDKADLLRDRIRQIALEKDIDTEPYQYERLMAEIVNKMKHLNSEFNFYYYDKLIDFTKPNFLMFSQKVLKSLLHLKKDSDNITLQKKNLDILSFFAFNKSWKEFDKSQTEAVNSETKFQFCLPFPVL